MGTTARRVPKSSRIDRKWRELGRRRQEPGRVPGARNHAALRDFGDSADDPLAMQKVVGSNPIIRSQEPAGNGGFLL